MKWLAVIASILGLAFLTACNLTPNALLGGEAPRDKDSYNPVVEAPSVKDCATARVRLKEAKDKQGCLTPNILDSMLRRVEEKDGKLVMTFEAIGEKVFPKLGKVTYQRGWKQTPELRELKCKNMTPVDDMAIRRVFECEMVRPFGAPYKQWAFALHSFELHNEKCEASAIYAAVPDHPECTPDDVNGLSVRYNSDYFPALADVENPTS